MGQRYRALSSGIALCALLMSHSPVADAERPVAHVQRRAPREQTKRICSTPISAAPRVPRELARPSTLILTQLSLLSPMLIGQTGADHELRVFAQTSLGGSYNAEPVSLAAPYVTIGVTALAYGAYAGLALCDGQRATSAMLFGMAETLLVVGLSKWMFGRAWPTNGRDPHAADRLEYPSDARSYAPFARGLAAFPSGHTAVMFAAASALRASSPELGVWRYAGYPLAAAVGLGMWWGDHHWASDVVGGAFLGEALGAAAGRAWAPEGAGSSIAWFVVPTQEGGVFMVTGQLP
jgi:membrane-associated phospholipid phosphatase